MHLDKQRISSNQAAGFTIVELLIVIVVIAILATITIIVFSGVQHRAGESSVKADIHNASTLIENYNAINGAYPDTLSAVNDGGGYAASNGNTVQYTSDSDTTYCLSIFRGDIAYHVSNDSKQALSGACVGHADPNAPAPAAQVVDHSVQNLATANTTYPLSLGTTVQPTDVLVILHIEHYAVGTAALQVNGSPVASMYSRSTGLGARPLRVTVVTNLSSTDTLAFRTDGSNVQYAYYVLRGINNPSQINIVGAGWETEGDNGAKSSGFTRSIAGGQTIKAGQVAILAYVGTASRINEFSGGSSPASSQWTLDESATPYSAYTAGSGTTPIPVEAHMLITSGGGQYIAGSIIVIGS